MASCIFSTVWGGHQRPADRVDVDDYFDLWSWDRTLDLIHHELM